MSLYALYLAEREGLQTLAGPHGFATYKQVSAEEFYLRDIFIEQGYRKQGIAGELSAEVARIAKAAGAARLIGSVCTDAQGVTVSMRALLGDGFGFTHAVGNMLYFSKKV